MSILLTGLQPTGSLTLGNYIGSIKQLIELQKKHDTIYLFVADLHAITMPQDPKELKERIRSLIALYIACGVDTNKTTIYIQSENSYIPAISWLLECVTPYGESSRMIQFKEKSKKSSNFSLGLLTYPVLMAADILYCDADFVPVGEDQKQHVELARNIAIKFNNKYGEVFKVPDCLMTKEGTRIKDLKDPTKKMSKSGDNPQGIVGMLDSEEVMRKKIMGATTDSETRVAFDEVNKPGISNLLNIASAISKRPINEIATDFNGKNYGEFKSYVAQVVIDELLPIQEKYSELINSGELDRILDKGIEISKKLAKEKYEKMKHFMGLTR